MRKIKASLVGAVAFLVLVGALPADAGSGIADVQVRTAKQENGPYEQFAFRANVTGRPKSFYFKVINQDDHAVEVLLEDSSYGADRADFGVRWFRGKQNITDDVRAATYDFDLKVSKAKVFRARVNPKVGNPGEMCLSLRMHVEPDDVNTGGDVYINDDSVCG